MSEANARELTAPAPLAAEHELEQFDSAAPPLDTWLKHRARQNEASGASRTYVICFARGSASRKVCIGVLPKHQRP